MLKQYVDRHGDGNISRDNVGRAVMDVEDDNSMDDSDLNDYPSQLEIQKVQMMSSPIMNFVRE